MARKARDYAAEYRRRVARGLAAGKSMSEAAGKGERDYHREYNKRVERDIAAGRRKPRSRPADNLSPRGRKLRGSDVWYGDDAADRAEAKINRLGSGSYVHLYVRALVWLVDADGEQVGDEVSHDFHFWPNGGIRAEALRRIIAADGSLEQTILRMIVEQMVGDPVPIRDDENPLANAANRRGKSARIVIDDEDEETSVMAEIERVIVQWTRT